MVLNSEVNNVQNAAIPSNVFSRPGARTRTEAVLAQPPPKRLVPATVLASATVRGSFGTVPHGRRRLVLDTDAVVLPPKESPTQR